MSLDEWILALHVLSAFSFVAGLVLFWVLVVAVRTTDTPDGTIRMEPIVKVGNAATGIGAGGTLIFGIWLAFSYGDYDIWDPWIVAALVLWVVTGALGQRTGVAYMQGMNKAKELERGRPDGAECRAPRAEPDVERAHPARRLERRRAAHRDPHDLQAGRMIELLAAVRPDEQNVPLLVHVVGATVLVGGLLTGASTLAFARGETRFLRLGYWTLLAVALPGYVVMRIGAHWIYSEQAWDDLPEGTDEPAWLGIGWIVADLGALLLLISLIAGGIGVRRLRDGKGAWLLKATMVIAFLILAAALVAVWAMAGKPD